MNFCPAPSRLRYVGAALLTLALAAPAAADDPVFGSWTSKCEETQGDKQGGCFIFQNLVLREGGQRVLQIAVGYVPDSHEPIALLSLPLGISLPPGVSIRIADGQPTRFPVERCEPNGCRAGLKLTPALVEQLARSAQLTVTFYDAQRRPIEVPLSLDGFKPGLDSVRPKS